MVRLLEIRKNTICDSFLASLGLSQKCFADAVLPLSINITKHILFSALLMVTLLSNLKLFVAWSGEVVTAPCQDFFSLTKLKAVSTAMTSRVGKAEVACLAHRGLVFLFLDFMVLDGKIAMTVWYFCSLW